MNDYKPILAVETSQNSCSACVYFGVDKFYKNSFEIRHSHAEKIFGLIDSVLAGASAKLDQVKSIAVSSGPGSFTGLRIGMSAVKSIAFALSIPLIPVPTFDAFALQAVSLIPKDSEFIIANRVNSEEIFYAKFRSSGGAESFLVDEELHVIRKEELQRKIDGSFLFGNAFVNLPPEVSVLIKNEDFITGERAIYAPGADFIAKWAERYGKKLLTYDFGYLEPNYLKDFIIKE